MSDGTLVVCLARTEGPGEHVRMLGGTADVVMAENVHGRVLLAAIIALLRWRDR